MQFNLPTTKNEMYNILNDIFHHYRIKRETYDGVPLEQLTLARMDYIPPSDLTLKTEAAALVAPDQQREIDKRKSDILKNITAINTKITAEGENALSLIQKVEELYDKSVESVENQARKNGLINSGILFDKLYQLEREKNAKILEVNAEKDRKIAELRAMLDAENELLAGCEEYFAAAHQKDIEKKFRELCDKREQMEKEVFKYNNGIEEKEQRYANTVIQMGANLEIKFLQISAGEFTKDQLTTMGYYEDVIRCVCGYYNTLNATNAYQDFSADQKLPIYLDDYYHNILYMYQAKAGL
jgi:transposase-like protein